VTPLFLLYLFEENTNLHDISKFEEFFVIQFLNIPINSLLQSDFSCFTESVLTPNLPIISLLSATFRRFTVTLFYYHKNKAYISLLVTTLCK